MPTLGTPAITTPPAPAPAAVHTVKIGDEWKHIPTAGFVALGENGQKAAEAAIAAVNADRVHMHQQRVDNAQKWLNDIQARPTYEADKALVNAELVRTADPDLIKFLNESGGAVHPAVFKYLLAQAKRNASETVVQQGGNVPAKGSEDAKLKQHYASMF